MYLLTPKGKSTSFYCANDAEMNQLLTQYPHETFTIKLGNHYNSLAGKQINQYLTDCEKYQTESVAELYCV